MQASLKQWDGALEDAKKCVELKPDWAKGYSRLGVAHHGLGAYQDAVDTFKKGLEIDGSNAALQSGLKEAEAALAGPSAFPGFQPGVRGMQCMYALHATHLYTSACKCTGIQVHLHPHVALNHDVHSDGASELYARRVLWLRPPSAVWAAAG